MDPAESMREAMIRAALDLIEERGGAAGVGIREVARRVGCSAPNAYNHFSGLEDLRLAALLRITAEYAAHMAAAMARPEAGEDPLGGAARAFLGFALGHPGWLYFYLFERLPEPRSAAEDADGRARGAEMAAIVAAASGGALEGDAALFATEAMYRYLVGALAEPLCGKLALADAGAFIEGTVESCRVLFAALVARGGR